MKKIIFTILVLFFSFTGIVFATNYPNYSNYVNDFTNTLSKDFVNDLNAKLLKYDQDTTNQIALALVKTVKPETIDQYSIHLAEVWKPGQKEKDNGVLMTFAMEDREMRIEVGRGLEGDVTDLEAKHIIDDVITPEFKNQQYEQGVSKGVDALILAIATTSAQTTGQADASGLAVIIIVVVLVLVLIAISPVTPLGGEGTWGVTSVWSSSSSGKSGGSSGGGFGGFGGGSFSGGGARGGW